MHPAIYLQFLNIQAAEVTDLTYPNPNLILMLMLIKHCAERHFELSHQAQPDFRTKARLKP